MAKHANHARHARKTFTSRSGKKCSRTKLPAHAYDDVILPSLMKERTRKIAASAAALAIVGALAAPMPAWAADWIQVAGTEHTQAASGTGETGGSWSWDGADDLLLDNYSGTGISAEGDLDITLEGENKVYDETSSDPATGTTEIPGGIYVKDGDLTITGEGSLDVSRDNAPAVLTTNGDISIEGTTVEATTTIDDVSVDWSSKGAITAEDGNIDIIASTVDATWSDKGDHVGTILAIYSTSLNGSQNAGTINIIDSNVTATVSAPDRKGENLNWANGIGAFSNTKGTAPLVNIDKSTVDVSTPGGAALRAWSRGEAEPGTINIHNSTLPEGSSIRDLYYTPGSGSPFAGQVLATGSGTITELDDPAILSSAHIERIADPVDPVNPVDPVDPVEPVEPATSPFAPAKAYAATNDASAVDSALPTTGDAPTGIFAAIAAALTAFGATLFSWKKSKTSKK